MKKLSHFLTFLGIATLSAGHIATAQPAEIPNIEINIDEPDISGLNDAMQLTHAGDGSNRIFVAERAGIVKVFQPGGLASPATFLDMTSRVGVAGEGGLLSLAFHPNYASNGYLFVYFTDPAGDLVIGRFTASGNAAPNATYVEILKIPHPNQENHNGGTLNFGSDGTLFASTGDGGGQRDPNGNGQNTASLLGKILRIDINVPSSASPRYSIPASNPIPGSPVFAWGLRNPFRWSFDRVTGDTYIGDVGQDDREEINHRQSGTLRGSNFGWRCFEGDIATPNVDRTGCGAQSAYVGPVYAYPTSDERGRSVVGGRVYRGSQSPLMYGWYIGTDYFSGEIHKIYRPDNYSNYEQGNFQFARNIGEDESGEIYVLKPATAHRIFAEQQLPVRLANFSGEKGNEGVRLTWNTTMEEAFKGFEVEFSTNAMVFEKVGTVTALNASAGSNYVFSHLTQAAGNLYYRLKMIDTDETFEYSRIITVKIGDELAGSYVRPSVIRNSELNLELQRPFRSLELINMNGEVFLKKDITGKSGAYNLPLGTTAAGLYIVRLADQDKVVQEKVLISE